MPSPIIFSTKTELDFAIQVLKANIDKINMTESFYDKAKVILIINHVIFDLEELKKAVDKQ